MNVKGKRSHLQTNSAYYLTILVAIASLILLGASSLRHFLLQSSALDLAAFDQWVYLLSQDLPPISSFFNVHVLGDHAAFILYPVSLLYRIYADVHWLLLVQAIALAIGAIPLYALSLQSGLSHLEAKAISLCYVLYPAIFNSNFYADFRPEAIAVPGLLWAMWAGLAQKPWQLVASVALVLSCKERLSLTVIALGIWFCLERRRRYGWGCIAAGIIWCGLTMGYIIPLLRNGNPSGLEFYGSLGGSLREIVVNILKNPTILLVRLFSFDSLGYCLLLVAPIILGLHWRTMAVLIPAIPMLLLNVLSDYAPQRDLIHHYSLPIFPFLFVWLVRSQALYRKRQQRQWLKPRWLIIWAAIAFLVLAKYDYFFTRYLSHLSNLPSVYAAISQVSPQPGGVLTASHLAPHLSHRPLIHAFSSSLPNLTQLQQYDYILLDKRHFKPVNASTIEQLTNLLQSTPQFQLIYTQNAVFLFKKLPS